MAHRNEANPDEPRSALDRLAGGIITAGEQHYSVSRRLKRQSSSSSYLVRTVSGPPAEAVLRVFDGPLDAPFEKLVGLSGKPGLATYSFAGECNWERKGRSGSPKRQLYGLVRPYEPLTLQKISYGSASTKRPVELINDITRGLASLHLAGIAHGELRPSNVLLTQENQVELADFAVASDLTAVEDLQFIAPEELIEGSIATSSGDIYSFGRLIKYILEHSLQTYREDWSKLGYLVAECTQPEPERRPNITEVTAILADSPPAEVLTKLQRLPQLSIASFADLSARATTLAGSRERYARIAIKRSIDTLAMPKVTRTALRLTRLSDAELIHLIASLALAFRRHKDFAFPACGYKLKDSMEAYFSPDSANDSIDGLWQSAIRAELTPHNQEELNRLREEFSFLPADDLARVLRVNVQDAEKEFSHRVDVASAIRANLLSQDAFVRSEDVTAIMSISCPGITVDEVRVLRDYGILLAVQDHGSSIYPLFQFQASTGCPYESIYYVNDRIGAPESSWGVLSWWMRSNRYLSGEPPFRFLRSSVNGDERVQGAVDDLLAA